MQNLKTGVTLGASQPQNEKTLTPVVPSQPTITPKNTSEMLMDMQSIIKDGQNPIIEQTTTNPVPLQSTPPQEMTVKVQPQPLKDTSEMLKDLHSIIDETKEADSSLI